MLKKSMYNYEHFNDDGDLLLCNLVKGTDSFLIIKKDDVFRFRSLNENDLDINSPIIRILKDKGILIDSQVDELLAIKNMYYDNIMNEWLSLTIMPTEKCNFRCKYCYETYDKGRMTQENQDRVLQFIQKKLYSCSKVNISWFGGEPLLEKGVISYIMSNVNNMCDKRKIPVTSNITTNGYYLDIDTFDKLYKSKVTGYQVTLDGLKEQHNKQRPLADGGGTFDRIIENLIEISNHKEYRFAGITVRINITKDNWESLDQFVEYFLSLFGDDRRFNLRFAITGDYGGEQISKYQDKLLSSTQIYERLENLDIYKINDLSISDMLSRFQPMNMVCYAARKNSYTIGSDLSVYRCTINFNDKHNQIGHIDEKGNLICDGCDYQWYLKSDNLPMECQTCFYLPCCYNAYCPLRMNFPNEENACSIQSVKNNLGSVLEYLSRKIPFEVLKFNSI